MLFPVHSLHPAWGPKFAPQLLLHPPCLLLAPPWQTYLSGTVRQTNTSFYESTGSQCSITAAEKGLTQVGTIKHEDYRGEWWPSILEKVRCGGLHPAWGDRLVASIVHEEVDWWQSPTTGAICNPWFTAQIRKALFKVQGTDVTLSSPNVAVLGEREPLTNCFMKFCLKLEELFHAICVFFFWYGEKYSVEEIY